jgi:hypothetical protein
MTWQQLANDFQETTRGRYRVSIPPQELQSLPIGTRCVDDTGWIWIRHNRQFWIHDTGLGSIRWESGLFELTGGRIYPYRYRNLIWLLNRLTPWRNR